MNLFYMVQVMSKATRWNGLFPSRHASFCASAMRTNRHRDTQNTYAHTHTRTRTHARTHAHTHTHTHTHKHNDRLLKVGMTVWERFTGHKFLFINTHTKTNKHTHTHTHTQNYATITHKRTDTAFQIFGSELHYGGCNTCSVVIPPLPRARTYADKLKHTHTQRARTVTIYCDV